MTETRAGFLIPDTLVKHVEDLLEDDEKLIAVMQPDPWRIALDWRNLYVSCVGLLGGVFWFFMLLVSLAEITWEVRCFLAVLFLGIFCLVLKPVFAYRAAKQTVYAVSNKRAIILQPLSQPKSYGRRDITQLKIKEYSGGTGDVYFSGTIEGVGARIGFLGIPQPEEVRRLMIEVFEFDEADFWSQ
jgi:hypothetical protein